MGNIDELTMADFADTLSQGNKKSDAPALSWVQEDKEKEEWTPVFTIPTLGQKLGIPRSSKELYQGEKKLMVFAYANECARWLFGEEMFHETVGDDGYFRFTPNTEFDA